MQLTMRGFMGPTQGPYILQLCMGPSYFCRGLTHPDPPLFRTLFLPSNLRVGFRKRLIMITIPRYELPKYTAFEYNQIYY